MTPQPDPTKTIYDWNQPMPEAKEEPKLQLVEGGYYRNRKGEKIGPMKLVSEHNNLPWPWTDGSTMFTEHGEYDTKPSEYDLIAPWTDEPQASEPIERVMGPDEIIRKGDTCVWSDGDIITAEHAIGTTVALAKACWKNACEYRTTRPKPSEPVPSQEYLTKMADAEDQCRSVAVGNFDTSNRDAILEAAERYADRRYRAGYECGKHGKKDLAAEGAASVAFQKFIEALNQ